MMICKNCNREIGNAAECPYCGSIVLMDPLPHHLPAGTLIGGRFAVEGVLGEGGFGITYLTRDTKLGSMFAIKEYYPRGISYRDQTGTNTVYVSSKDDTEFYAHGKERFLSEARTLAKFSEEPGVVSVTDYIEENDTVYLVMEYLRGETLQKYLKHRGKLGANEAFSMLDPVIKTLQKIHEAGVIHRDISPDNIMVLKNGQLKLMDFGAAKEYVDDNRSMSVMLKKGYAPMEQYRRNGKQGPWTDVYAMCATIYRCITGKTPDDALDRVVEDTLQKPSALGADISPAKEGVLMYGLAVHQQDRCQSMVEMLNLWDQADPAASSNSKTNARGAKPAPDPNATIYADDYKSAPDATVFANESELNRASAAVQQQPVVNQQYSAPNAPKKKSKKGLVIGIVAAVLVIAITVGVLVIKPWKIVSDLVQTGSNTVISKQKSADSGNTLPTQASAKSGDSYYKWKVTGAVWNTEKDDREKKISRISKTKKLYLHFRLECSPKGGSMKPVINVTQPDGTREQYVFDKKVPAGWTWYGFEYDDPQNVREGTLTVTICDENGNEMYTGSIEIVA